jgi:glycosyltransferase involved in cell wall biosynthesis
MDGETAASHKRPLVIVPAYNEASRIGELIEQLYEQNFDVVVVDDHSIDSTAKIVKKSNAKHLRHCNHMGHGIALQTGYQYAIRKGYEYIVQMDCDGTHSPESVKTLFATLKDKDADVVIGNRHVMVDGNRVQKHRKIEERLSSYLLQKFTGVKVSDPFSGFQALRLNILHFYACKLFADDFTELNVLLLSHRMGYKIAEAPVVVNESENLPIYVGFLQSIVNIILLSFYFLGGPFKPLPNREDLN